MNQIHFLGRTVPAWVLLVVIIIASAGAATSVALNGIDNETTLAVNQGLRIGTPVNNPQSGADSFIGQVSDDGTSFSVYAEANNGDLVVFDLPIYYGANLSLLDVTMEVPEGITADVEGDDGTTAVRTGTGTWKVKLSDNGEALLTFYLRISPTTLGVFEFDIQLAAATL